MQNIHFINNECMSATTSFSSFATSRIKIEERQHFYTNEKFDKINYMI